MTDPTASSPAAGWYPDPAGSASERYWDGSRWTEQLRAAAGSPPAAPAATPSSGGAAAVASPSADGQYDRPVYQAQAGSGAPRELAADVKVTTPWAWAIALLPLLSIIAFATFDFRSYLVDTIRLSLADPSTTGGVPEFPSLGGALLVGFVGFLVTVGTIVFAYLDWRALRARGVVRPFHWAWSFFALAGAALGALVYMIGRSVVVFRQSRRGLGPLWLLIGVVLLSIIVVVAKYVDALSALEGILPGVTGLD